MLPDVEKAATKIKPLCADIGPTSIFDAEGTKEIYVGQSRSASLLLMEPTKDGSYKKALEKRGPSLHHIAIDVLSLNNLLPDAIQAGWSLHPHSEQTIPDIKVAWLYKKDFSSLIEVSEVKEHSLAQALITKIHLKVKPEHKKLIQVLCLQEFIESSDAETEIFLESGSFKITRIL